jgi:hypothetical protein
VQPPAAGAGDELDAADATARRLQQLVAEALGSSERRGPERPAPGPGRKQDAVGAPVEEQAAQRDGGLPGVGRRSGE